MRLLRRPQGRQDDDGTLPRLRWPRRGLDRPPRPCAGRQHHAHLRAPVGQHTWAARRGGTDGVPQGQGGPPQRLSRQHGRAGRGRQGRRSGDRRPQELQDREPGGQRDHRGGLRGAAGRGQGEHFRYRPPSQGQCRHRQRPHQGDRSRLQAQRGRLLRHAEDLRHHLHAAEHSPSRLTDQHGSPDTGRQPALRVAARHPDA
mmetsp:Transcript_20206/g.77372  ORF Transcript_20206/g.77372 Transcript_20206/m.77372 type:complete len:201 (+) Transcript_20206:418-1020(+)